MQEHYCFSANISKALQPLYPAVMEVEDEGQHDLINAAARQNVRRVVRELRDESSPAIRRPQKHGLLKVVGAFYHLASGQVDWLDD
jgi:carbonic anhydrase